jgi:protein-tyrosine phosphatase
MIDLHTHVLPGLDDGPRDLDDALDLARAAVTLGTRRVVATPHIDSRFGVEPEELPAAVAALNAAYAEHGIDLEAVTGGEIATSRVRDLTDEQLEGLGLGGGPYLLIESPHTPAAVVTDIEAVIFDLQVRGHQILIAHPERSPVFQAQPDRLRRLVDGGALCSITAGSMKGRFGQTVRRFTVMLLREGLVHNVASDAHDDVRRPPGLLTGFETMESDVPGVAAQAEWLTEEMPAAILSGAPLPERPELPEAPRRKLFGLFRRNG